MRCSLLALLAGPQGQASLRALEALWGILQADGYAGFNVNQDEPASVHVQVSDVTQRC